VIKSAVRGIKTMYRRFLLTIKTDAYKMICAFVHKGITRRYDIKQSEVHMKQQRNAKIMLISSMTVFGTIGLFVRNIQLPSGEIALYRAVLAAILITIYLFVTKQRIPFKTIKKEIPLLLASGIAMGINWILLFEAYKYTTVSLATLSYYFAPVIVTVACPFLFREKLTAKQIICFIMSTLGLVLITGIGDVGTGGSDFVGILFGLGAAVFYATVILMNKFIKNVAGIHRTLLQFLAAILVLMPYIAATSGVNLQKLNTTGWICLLIVGIVHTGITYCLYFSSLKELPGQKAAILSYIDPLVAVLVSVLILGEQMTLWQVIGGILILGFTLWNEITV
jgi:RarD protein